MVLAPPCSLITVAVNLAMMTSAEGYGKLIADFETQGPGLRKAQMMRVRRLPAADEAGL